MRRESSSAQVRPSREQVRPGRKPPTLTNLAQRFAQFRSHNARFTRVPQELRAAVVRVMSAGVTVSALRCRCGVSSSQIAAWQASCEREEARAEPTQVRAFSVIDAAPSAGALGVSSDETLELRLGPWSVSVRIAAQTPARRG